MWRKLVIDFNTLPETTRRRFVAAAGGSGNPEPLWAVREREKRNAWIKPAVYAVISLGLLYWVARAGLGEGIDGIGYLVLYGLFGAFFCAALLTFVDALLAKRRRPYRSGVYLFPLDLVIAEDDTLVVLPLAGLSGVQLRDLQLRGRYVYTEVHLRFGFGDDRSLKIATHAQAEQLARAIRESQLRAAAAFENEQLDLLAKLDPFFEARAGEWREQIRTEEKPGRTGPLYRKPSFLLANSRLIGSVLGVGLGFGLLSGRNWLSDEMMFARAKERGSTRALHGYVEKGGKRHVTEVREVLLPQAEFEEAFKARSVSAIRALRKKYPDSVHDERAKQEIHANFEAARESFEAQAGSSRPELLAKMREMFAWLEAHDAPRVELRFRAPNSNLLEEVDKQLAALPREATLGIEVSKIAPSFSAGSLGQYEDEIVKLLDAGFAGVVPSDILDLEQGEPISTEVNLASFRPPRATIVVDYLVDASGSIYINETNTEAYVGIVVYFAVTIFVPGIDFQPASPPLTFQLQVEPPEQFSVLQEERTSAKVKDMMVYDVMAQRAFDNLSTKLRGALFSAGDASGLEIVIGDVPTLERSIEDSPFAADPDTVEAEAPEE